MSNERVKRGLLAVLPDGWSAERLGHIGLFLRSGGGSKQDEVDDGLPCVRYGDLYTHHDCRITDTRSRIRPDRVNSYTPLRYGDILFASSGENVDDIGRSAVNLMRGRAYCGGDVIILRPAIEINASFLGHVADCASSRIQKSRLGRGSTVIHIYDEELRDLVIPVPPLDEQQRIADILDTIDESIQASERVISKHEQVLEGILQRASLGRPDSKLSTLALADFCALSAGRTAPRSVPEYYGGGIPWIKSGEVAGSSVLTTEETVSAKAVQDLQLRIVPSGTPVVAMYGATAGEVGWLEIDAATNQAVLAVEPEHDRANRRWLYWALRIGSRRMLASVQGSGQPNLSKQIIGATKISLPDLEMQLAEVARIDSAHASIEAHRATAKKLRGIRTGLVGDLLSGRIRTVAA
ncbi:MAG: restriction endonuclease subunit S [Acidimicrobiaceae bacterium]|nr:restriction endonuclease subunit S [Acidimicrobiaceae bacterium]